jgi:hypothetical protein
MQKRISDLPPLLPPGVHSLSLERLRSIGVAAFPLSTSRPDIYAGFLKVHSELEKLGIPGTLIVDGSFLTEEIDPSDIDFAVCVSPQFYETCTAEQLAFLDWIRDSFDVKSTHRCDCYLCVEFPEGHPDWFNGIQNRKFWVDLFSLSVVHKRIRGVGAIELEGVSS